MLYRCRILFLSLSFFALVASPARADIALFDYAYAFSGPGFSGDVSGSTLRPGWAPSGSPLQAPATLTSGSSSITRSTN